MSAQAAITAAINAKFSTPPVLTLKQAQSATKDYIVLFVSRRYVDKRLVSGEVPLPGGRVIVRSCCTSEDNVDVYRARITAALEDRILSDDSGPFVFETEDTNTDLDAALGTTWFVTDSHWTF